MRYLRDTCRQIFLCFNLPQALNSYGLKQASSLGHIHFLWKLFNFDTAVLIYCNFKWKIPSTVGIWKQTSLVFKWSKTVRLSNGPFLSHVFNSKIILRYSNGKTLVTEWHLVTVLFTMVGNWMVQTIQLATIWIPNK